MFLFHKQKCFFSFFFLTQQAVHHSLATSQNQHTSVIFKKRMHDLNLERDYGKIHHSDLSRAEALRTSNIVTLKYGPARIHSNIDESAVI